MLYHFDYLTLVLVGALDAEARVARRANGLTTGEWQASFRRDRFLKELRDKGASQLYDMIKSQRIQDFFALLHELRNSIHAAALKAISVRESTGQDEMLVTAPQDIAESMWEAATRLGGAESWGLRKSHHDVLIEPYSYATMLTEKGLDVIDEIASATDVVLLFSKSEVIPTLSEGPPEGTYFDDGERLALLG